MNAQDMAAMSNAFQSMFLGKKETTTRRMDPTATADFNSIMQSLSPMMKTSSVTQGDLDTMLASVMSEAKKAFAPAQAAQASTGGYNSSSLQAMKDNAMAQATNASIKTMVDAKLAGQQGQQQAAQIAAQLTAQRGQLSGKTQVSNPAALGKAALPALLGLVAAHNMGGDKAAGSPTDIGKKKKTTSGFDQSDVNPVSGIMGELGLDKFMADIGSDKLGTQQTNLFDPSSFVSSSDFASILPSYLQADPSSSLADWTNADWNTPASNVGFSASEFDSNDTAYLSNGSASYSAWDDMLASLSTPTSSNTSPRSSYSSLGWSPYAAPAGASGAGLLGYAGSTSLWN